MTPLWIATLEDGSVIQYPANWMEINQPITEFVSGDVGLKGKESYYITYHAVASPGGQGRLTKFEFGYKDKGTVHSYTVTPTQDGMLKKEILHIPLDGFEYKGSLKQGKEV